MISLQKDKTGGFAEFCWLLCILYLIFQLRGELRFLPEFSLSRLPNREGTGETYRDDSQELNLMEVQLDRAPRGLTLFVRMLAFHTAHVQCHLRLGGPHLLYSWYLV